MTSVVGGITEIWGAVMTWVTGAIPDVVSVFWNAESGFTFLGTLASVALGISIFFLIMGFIQKFLHLRG